MLDGFETSINTLALLHQQATIKGMEVGSTNDFIAINKAIEAYNIHPVIDKVFTFVPIPGTKRISYLLENLGALDVQLSGEDLTRIDIIVPKGAFSGERYPAALMQMVNI